MTWLPVDSINPLLRRAVAVWFGLASMPAVAAGHAGGPLAELTLERGITPHEKAPRLSVAAAGDADGGM